MQRRTTIDSGLPFRSLLAALLLGAALLAGCGGGGDSAPAGGGGGGAPIGGTTSGIPYTAGVFPAAASFAAQCQSQRTGTNPATNKP